MEPVIKGHPRLRMAERQVTLDDVKSVVADYSYSTTSKSGTATVLFGVPRNDGRVLKVVLVGSPPRQPPTVKTVAWKDEEDV